jgi:hypothetical protein
MEKMETDIFEDRPDEAGTPQAEGLAEGLRHHFPSHCPRSQG